MSNVALLTTKFYVHAYKLSQTPLHFTRHNWYSLTNCNWREQERSWRWRDWSRVFLQERSLTKLAPDFLKLGSVTTLRSLIRILHASLVQIGMEMAEKYANTSITALNKMLIRNHQKILHQVA